MDIEAPRPGDRARIAGVYISLDWTTRATSPDCTEWGRRADPGWNRLKAETTAGRACTGQIKMCRYGIVPFQTVTTRNPWELYNNPQLSF